MVIAEIKAYIASCCVRHTVLHNSAFRPLHGDLRRGPVRHVDQGAESNGPVMARKADLRFDMGIWIFRSRIYQAGQHVAGVGGV